MTNKNIVFVYGTFMRGKIGHSVMKTASIGGCKYLGPAYTVQHFSMYDCGEFPTVVQDPNGFPLKGEVYEVDDATLHLMDDIEGHPDFFERREFLLDTGQLAWVYTWDKSRLVMEPMLQPKDGVNTWA